MAASASHATSVITKLLSRSAVPLTVDCAVYPLHPAEPPAELAVNSSVIDVNAVAPLTKEDPRLKELVDEVQDLLKSPDAVCRETAAGVLGKLLKKKELGKALKVLSDDPVPQVRAYSQHLAGA